MSSGSKTWKYGDDVDTDVIIPARYLTTSDPAELAVHCMEDLDAGFAKGVKPGDVMVAGKNFGCGSSREHAPIAIKAAGISCIVAHSFARIFYRNSINIGLPILECPAAAAEAQAGDTLEVDLETGTIHNRTKGTSHKAAPFPPFMRSIMDAGGLIGYVSARLAAGSSAQAGA